MKNKNVPGYKDANMHLYVQKLVYSIYVIRNHVFPHLTLYWKHLDMPMHVCAVIIEIKV